MNKTTTTVYVVYEINYMGVDGTFHYNLSAHTTEQEAKQQVIKLELEHDQQKEKDEWDCLSYGYDEVPFV